MYKMSKKSLVLIGLALSIVFLIVMYFSGVLKFFSLENLKSHREMLVNFVAKNYFWSVLIYLLATILIVATTLPLAAFMMILAGMLFGVKWGAIYINIGLTLGACISFFWLRYAFGETVPAVLKARLVNFSKKIEQYGSFYFLSMHLMSLLIIVTLGSATLILHNPWFIKWKPTGIYWITAMVFLWSHFFNNKTIIQKVMEKDLVLPQIVWLRINAAWILFFIIMGFANLYIAYNYSTKIWVNFKLFGGIGLTLLFVMAQALYLSRHIQERN